MVSQMQLHCNGPSENDSQTKSSLSGGCVTDLSKVAVLASNRSSPFAMGRSVGRSHDFLVIKRAVTPDIDSGAQRLGVAQRDGSVTKSTETAGTTRAVITETWGHFHPPRIQKVATANVDDRRRDIIAGTFPQ